MVALDRDDRAARAESLIAKPIVEAHGGRLDVESVVGCGATFTFLLPGVRSGLRRLA